MKAADEIFLEKSYSSLIQNLQDYDKQFSFRDPSLPEWYSSANEPISEAGLKMFGKGVGVEKEGVEREGVEKEGEGKAKGGETVGATKKDHG
jgi:hypothetical protein